MGRVQSKRSTSFKKKKKKETLIFDARPLIYLCKVNLARHLHVLVSDFQLLTTQEVYDEVYTSGLQRGKPAEVQRLKELFDTDIVDIVTFSSSSSSLNKVEEGNELKTYGIHTGEITIIQAALSLGATAILGDKRARLVARSMGVDLGGTVTVIIEVVKREAISKSAAKEAINSMINEKGWYCSAKDYILMMEAIDSA